MCEYSQLAKTNSTSTSVFKRLFKKQEQNTNKHKIFAENQTQIRENNIEVIYVYNVYI